LFARSAEEENDAQMIGVHQLQLEPVHVRGVGRSQVRRVDELEREHVVLQIDRPGLEPWLVTRSAVVRQAQGVAVEVVDAGHRGRVAGPYGQALHYGGPPAGERVARSELAVLAARSAPLVGALPGSAELLQS